MIRRIWVINVPTEESKRAGSETQKKKKKDFFLLLKKCCLLELKNNSPTDTLHLFSLATINKFSETLKLP